MRYISLIKNEDDIIVSQIKAPDDLSDELIMDIDELLRKNGILDEDTELCITSDFQSKARHRRLNGVGDGADSLN